VAVASFREKGETGDMGVIRGAIAPFRGVAFVARHGLWGYLVLPLLLNAGLATLSVWLGVRLVRQKIGAELFTASPVVAWTILAVFASVVGLLFFMVLQPVVGAPFVDLLSERTEKEVRGHAPAARFWRSVGQALLHGLLKTTLYGIALAVVLVLGAVSGIGGGLGVVLYAIFLAYDGFDYPLSRRGISFGGKWRYLAVHPGQTLGYCLGASVLYLVPLAVVVAPAFSAVGATLAYLDSEPAPPADVASPTSLA
jgi:CysZ protein